MNQIHSLETEGYVSSEITWKNTLKLKLRVAISDKYQEVKQDITIPPEMVHIKEELEWGLFRNYTFEELLDIADVVGLEVKLDLTQTS